MLFSILFVVFAMAPETIAHVTAAPATHGPSTTSWFSPQSTTVEAISTWQPPRLPPAPAIQMANDGDNDEPPERPGFTDPDASSTSTTPLPASVSSTAGHEAGETSTVTRARSGALPAEYLSQVPRGWPYTKFGLGRRKETTTWSLTNGDGEMVGVVQHEVLWYPRPFWTGATTLLDGWKPTFVVKGGVGPASAAASDGDGSIRLVEASPKKEAGGALAPAETKVASSGG